MTRSLAEIADTMRRIDVAMLVTRSEDGAFAARPMSNNGDVTWTGTSRYFTTEDTRMVADIARDPAVALTYEGADGFYLSVAGEAALDRDRGAFAAHWVPDLDAWFEDGIDTEGLVMLVVEARRAHWWQREENGAVAL